jgi:hypothetical protein
LYWTEEGEKGEYAVLSYCWGGPQTVSSTTETAQDFTDGILLSRLPQTLQDAIITTSELGLRYIWVDCLCIIQDDPEDVAREISKMADIFSQATVTISAASARTVHDGFLRPQSPIRDTPLQLPFQTTGGNVGSILMEQPRNYTPEEDPISLRAWTLQEHFLSQRILMFSTKELWWTCKETWTQNSTTWSEAEESSLFRAGNRVSLSYWRSLVEDYSRRFLTYPRDKLPALAGIAADYSQKLDDTYIAGLWQSAFLAELLWSSKRSDISRPAVQRAPSWSWAAIDGEISHDWCPLGFQGTLDVIYIQVTPVSNSSPFGSIDPVRSELRVEGHLCQVYWRSAKDYIFVDSTRSPGTGIDVGRTQADADEPIPKEEETGNLVVWALALSQRPTRGLILVQVHDDTFRRVGIFFRLWDESIFQVSECRVISIV